MTTPGASQPDEQTLSRYKELTELSKRPGASDRFKRAVSEGLADIEKQHPGYFLGGSAPTATTTAGEGGPVVNTHWRDEVEAAEKAKPAPAKTTGLEAFGRGAAQGGSLGFADEAAGFGSWLAGKLGAGDDSGIERTYADGKGSYSSMRDSERAANVKAAEDTKFDKSGMSKTAQFLTPDSVFGAGELAGGVATAAAPVGGAAKGATLATRLAQGAKAGAKIGGVAGFGAGEGDAVDQAISTGTGAAAGAVLAPVAGEVARGAGKLATGARRGVGKFTDWLAGGPAEREVLAGTPELARKVETLADPVAGKETRALAVEGADDAVIEGRARDISKQIDELQQHGDVIKWEEDIASKGRAIDGMMRKQAPPVDGLTKADDVYNAVRSEWDQLASDVGKGEGSATVSRLQREAFDAYENRLKKAIDKFDPSDPTAYVSERFMALDDLKRQLQREIARGKVPFDDLLRDRMEAPLRTSLEDPALWGEGPAVLQQVRNRGWTRALRKQGNPESTFLADNVYGEQASDPYRTLRAADPGKVGNIVRNAGKLEGERGAQTLTEWADREAGLLEALTQHDSADAALVTRAKRARELATAIKGSVGERSKQAAAARELEQVAAVPGPKPGVVSSVLEKTPLAPIVERMRPMPMGQRAQRMAELERVLRRNPKNAPAADELAGIVPGGRTERVAESTGRGAERAAASAGVGMRAPSMAGATAEEDEQYGPMLAAKSPEERAVAVSVLTATDPKFRERQRARSGQQQPQQEQGR